jgi:hypothetical protein
MLLQLGPLPEEYCQDGKRVKPNEESLENGVLNFTRIKILTPEVELVTPKFDEKPISKSQSESDPNYFPHYLTEQEAQQRNPDEAQPPISDFHESLSELNREVDEISRRLLDNSSINSIEEAIH